MINPDLLSILPQLASASAHTHALGFQYEGLTDDDAVRLRVPWRADLVGGRGGLGSDRRGGRVAVPCE